MARYDEFTKEFMDKVAEGAEVQTPQPPKPADQIVEDTARRGLLGLKGFKEHGAKGLLLNTLVPSAFRKLFESEKTGSMSIMAAYNHLNNNYDTDWWDWEPETIWEVLLKDEGIEATDEVKNLVMALQTVLRTNAAHEGWHVFENVCQAFNGNTVDFSTVTPAELTEIALTLKVLGEIRPKQEFDDEIWIYIAACARNAGVVFLPPELFGGSGTCQKHLDNMDMAKTGLKDQVRKYWNSGNLKSSDPAIQVQLARLNEIKEYVEEHHG